MARVAALAALCASACFSKPPFSGHGGTGDGGTQDGNPSDGQQDDAPDAPFDAPLDAPQGCTSIFRDDFSDNGVNPCGGWGSETGTWTTSREMDGLLIRRASMSPTGSGGCVSDEFNITNGASARLAHAMTSVMGDYQRLRLTPMGFGGTAVMVLTTPADVRVSVVTHLGTALPGTSFSPTTMKWFKLVPTGTAIVASYSPDGQTWTVLGSDDYQTSFGLGTVELVGGNSTVGVASIDYVLWDDFNILTCPP